MKFDGIESYLGQTIFLNPRWSEEDRQHLRKLADWALDRGEVNFGLKGEDVRSHQFKSPKVFATSGSTSASVKEIKLVVLEQEALFASARRVNLQFQIQSSDRWLNPLPLFHVGGQGVYYRAKLLGSEVLPLSDYSKTWDVISFYKALVDQNIQWTSLVPTQIFDLTKAKLRAPARFKAVFVGGGGLSDAIRLEATALGWRLIETYGMTETASMIAARKDCGQGVDFFKQVEVKLNADSRLMIKCDSLLSAYIQYKKGKASVWDPKDQGWFTSEDRFHYSKDDNAFTFQGRMQDQIKILGELVSLAGLREKLEQDLLRMGQDPYQWAIDAQEDPRAGYAIVLYVESSVEQGIVDKVLQMWRGQLRSFEVPKEVFRINRIPRGGVGGKVLWSELRQTRL